MDQFEVTHYAFSDEAYYRGSRFRSIALISLEQQNFDSIQAELTSLLAQSCISEFKWSGLGGARERFAAIKLIDKTIILSLDKLLRVDVLIWDIKDSRHDIKNRDDLANLQRMYYHLFDSTLRIRWPSESTWELFPDEQSIIDWSTMEDILQVSGRDFRLDKDIFSSNQFRYNLFSDYQILRIEELESHSSPLVQLADLFAGLGAYSHSSYEKFLEWKREESAQIPMGLFEKARNKISLSKRDRERCKIIDHLNNKCKKHKLSISLESIRGFFSYKPHMPINFWVYEPQHPQDKAPTM
jgi:hypothetical protein